VLSRVFLNSQLTQEFFAGFMGESVEPKDVFLAFTVDQGGNVVNACAALGVEVIKCNCHRVNSAVLWSLGIAGSATTCKNKPMGALMKKLAACVGVWSHSAVNNDKLKDIQRQLEEDFHEIYELLRRNDTRCDCIYLFVLILFWNGANVFVVVRLEFLYGTRFAADRLVPPGHDIMCVVSVPPVHCGIETLPTAPCSFFFFLV